MSRVPTKIQTWQMVRPAARDKETGEVTPGKIEKTEIPVPELDAGRGAGRSGRLRRLPHRPGVLL